MSNNQKYMFVLIGSPGTGKTWLQKKILEECCDLEYEKLPSHCVFKIVQAKFKSIYSNIFFSGRSLQETMGVPRKVSFFSIKEYFQRIFQEIEICFIASHVYEDDLKEIVAQEKKRGYTVIAIFSKPRIEESSMTIEQLQSLGFDDILITNRGQLSKERSDIVGPILNLLRSHE